MSLTTFLCTLTCYSRCSKVGRSKLRIYKQQELTVVASSLSRDELRLSRSSAKPLNFCIESLPPEPSLEALLPPESCMD